MNGLLLSNFSHPNFNFDFQIKQFELKVILGVLPTTSEAVEVLALKVGVYCEDCLGKQPGRVLNRYFHHASRQRNSQRVINMHAPGVFMESNRASSSSQRSPRCHSAPQPPLLNTDDMSPWHAPVAMRVKDACPTLNESRCTANYVCKNRMLNTRCVP